MIGQSVFGSQRVQGAAGPEAAIDPVLELQLPPAQRDEDAGIIRNRAKVDAVIENARRILALRESHGSFARWLDAQHPRSRERWRILFKETFVFTGGEIVGEFLT